MSTIISTALSAIILMLFEWFEAGVGVLFGYILFTSLIAIFLCLRNIRDVKMLASFAPIIVVNGLFVVLYVSGTVLVE